MTNFCGALNGMLNKFQMKTVMVHGTDIENAQIEKKLRVKMLNNGNRMSVISCMIEPFIMEICIKLK